MARPPFFFARTVKRKGEITLSGTKKIKDGIYYTGILNPNMRVFDVVMRTEYGTSYNAYTVVGSEKTALIDASHLTFAEDYLETLEQVCDIAKVDYLVMNHCEPDHSGAVAKLVEKYPDITVLVSQAGSIYLKGITNNPNMKVEVVKNGDTRDLGGKTLTFLSAPFLHWPDSIFTYLPEDKVVFTCDFLGAHYCEPLVWDNKVTYPKAYEEAVKVYYDAIFSPFASYVRKGLDILSTLDFDTACTSHGPILTKGCCLEWVMEQYRQWSAEPAGEKPLIPIFYCSAYGNTTQLAEEIRAGILSVKPEAEIPLYNVIEHDLGEQAAALNRSTAFLLGSPTINRNAVPPIWNLLAHIDAIGNQKKPVAVFGSFGWSGEAVPLLNGYLSNLKFNVAMDGLKVTFVPSEEDLKKAFAYGKEFAEKL